MTLVLTINGPEAIWLLADRRLSFKGRPPKDDARKVMFLETNDGVAILGYAGLGATPHGTEPADWMSAVLRGRNLPLEQSLGVLASAIKRQFPHQTVKMPGPYGPAHNVIITAFLNNQVRLYSIDLAFTPNRKSYDFRFTRYLTNPLDEMKARTPRISVGGTGGMFLLRDKSWIRSLLDLVNANDRGKVTPYVVADFLAKLNNDVYLGIGDKSVGPRCIVAWRYRKNGVHKGGGGHQFYDGGSREKNSPSLPSILNGIDFMALTGVIFPRAAQHLKEMLKSGTDEGLVDDTDEINAELAKLPEKPDETFI